MPRVVTAACMLCYIEDRTLSMPVTFATKLTS